MLKKRKGPHAETEQRDESISTKNNTIPKPATPPAVSSEGNTIIGENISIEGTLRGKENLIIEGTMKGKIELEQNKLTIGRKGQVEADIQAENITVSGHLTGNIKAKGKVELTKEADFTGEIQTNQISVEDGAYIKAAIEMEQASQKSKPATENIPVQLVSATAGKETTDALNTTYKKDN